MRNPIIFFLVFLFTIVNLLDIVTTYFILPAESNPLFNMIGKYWFIVLFKLFFIGLAWWLYLKNVYLTRFIYFLYILILTLSLLLIGLAVFANIYGILHPQLIIESSQVPIKERTVAYFQMVSIIYVLPMILCIIAYKLHEIGIKYIKVINGGQKKKNNSSNIIVDNN